MGAVLALLLSPSLLSAQAGTEYAKAMKAVARRFKGNEGVVLQIGDSITYANPYSQWPKYGKGKTAQDKAILKWMHAGEKNDLDGWHLCSVDRPGGRSETAVSGIRVDQFLKGGKSGIAPVGEIIKRYKPRMAVVMLGTNDCSAGRPVKDFAADMSKITDLLVANGTIPIISTIPPHHKREDLAKSYNDALRAMAKQRGLPLIDFYAEIVKRRPNDWNGTLLGKDNVHPTAKQGGTGAADAPTEENLRNSGYLLRSWLSVQKIAEVKRAVLD